MVDSIGRSVVWDEIMPSKRKVQRHLNYRKLKGWKPLPPNHAQWAKLVKVAVAPGSARKIKAIVKARRRRHVLNRKVRAHLRRQHS